MIAKKWVQKPVEIEAIRFNLHSKDCLDELKAFIGKDILLGEDPSGCYTSAQKTRYIIKTTGKDITTRDGEYIVKTERGEFYSCDEAFLHKNYDLA